MKIIIINIIIIVKKIMITKIIIITIIIQIIKHKIASFKLKHLSEDPLVTVTS